jgi:UDP:flavonoid glycosyltransferase YjiC (YdhE family)
VLPESIFNQNVLISPLNWGMGHVARSIAIIQQLLDQQNEIFVACDEDQKAIFEVYFSQLTFIAHRPYPFQFSGKGKWAMDLFQQRKKLLNRFGQERLEVEKYIFDFQIDVVISDHRYGFFSKVKPSIFITHQLHLPLKWFQKPMQYVHQKLIRNFSSVWVLDDENSSLAGKLSKKIKHKDLHYIGWKSRFQLPADETKICDNLYLVSGPLPYSQDFLNECIEMAKIQSGSNVCIYPNGLVIPPNLPDNLFCLSSNNWKLMDAYIRGAKFIISRSGYSTVMDLKVLNKKSLLTATPGQAEQEYLVTLVSASLK